MVQIDGARVVNLGLKVEHSQTFALPLNILIKSNFPPGRCHALGKLAKAPAKWEV